MNKIIFLVENAHEDGFTARALGTAIFTEADHINELHGNSRAAVVCHFEPDAKPKMIRLHFIREEVIVA